MGRRGLSWCDDNVEEDSEKLSQRSNDFRLTTRRGGEDGVQMVLVHRNCCEEYISGSARNDESFDRHEAYMVLSELGVQFSNL